MSENSVVPVEQVRWCAAHVFVLPHQVAPIAVEAFCLTLPHRDSFVALAWGPPPLHFVISVSRPTAIQSLSETAWLPQDPMFKSLAR